MSRYACELGDIVQAAARIRPFAHRTPVATCATLDRMAGRSLFFKCENQQKGGAFKFRGAVNAIAQLPREVAQRGVVTHSSGNHAQALALAARLHGIAAHIVMPSTAAAVKRRAVEEYGGRVVLCEPNLAARESTAARVMAETGATMIPPYNHPHVIAGQGTVALELMEQVPDLDAIIAPVGGGGLVSGIALAVKSEVGSQGTGFTVQCSGVRKQIADPSPPTPGPCNGVKVFAAEPAGADDAFRSKAAGKLVPQTGPNTVADGLLTSLGELTWPVIRDLVDDVITAQEHEIIAAMRTTWERAKLLIEPSSAVPLAAVLSDSFRSRPGLRRIGIVLSGGNVDLDRLPWQTR